MWKPGQVVHGSLVLLRGSAATYQKGVFQDGCLLPPSLHDQKEPKWWEGAGMKAEPVI